MKGYRKGGGYHSRGDGDGLRAAHKVEAEDRVNYKPSMKADKGESGPLPKAGRDGGGSRSTAIGGATSQGIGPIHQRFNFGNNSTGRGHQAHVRGEHKKY